MGLGISLDLLCTFSGLNIEYIGAKSVRRVLPEEDRKVFSKGLPVLLHASVFSHFSQPVCACK